MLDRTIAPPIHDFEPFVLPQPSSVQLPNGIPFKLFINPHLDLIHFIIRVKAGVFFEKQKNVAAFCYSILSECHPSLSANEFDGKLDYFGATLNLSVGFEYVTISFIVPKTNCKNAFSFLSEVLISPSFKEESVKKQKEIKIKNWEYSSLKTDIRANRLMYNAFFGNEKPYGKIIEISDIQSITPELLTEFYHDTFSAPNIKVYATGNIDDELEKHIATCISHFPAGNRSMTTPQIIFPKLPPKIVDYWENAMQTSLVLCRPCLSYTDQEYFDFEILSTFLGGYFGSRLMQNLREKNGYTYSVNSASSYFADQSVFFIETEVNNDNVDYAIEACFTEMKILREQLADEEELNNVKQFILGSLLRSIDGTIQYMKKYIGWEDYAMTEQSFYDGIAAVQKADVQLIKSLANKYLKEEDFTTIVVGKYPSK